MKIGMLVNNLEVSGGYQKLVIRLAQQLKALKHDVVVYAARVDTENCYPADIHTIQIKTLEAKDRSDDIIVEMERLATYLPTNLDIIINHDDYSLFTLAKYQKPAKTTVVWMLNNQLPEALAKPAKQALKAWRETPGKRTKVKHTIKQFDLNRRQKKGLALVDKFATYDSFNKDLIKRDLHREATNVYAGADLDTFQSLAKKRQPQQSVFNVLSVGVIFPHRRYEDLIRAAALLKKKKISIKVTIIGKQDLSPDYFKRLQAIVKEKGLGRTVTFKNYVTDQEMQDYYRAANVFVFINDGFTWGISVFEAVAAGLPVIITDNIGAADLIDNQVDGWVVPPRNPQAVAKALQEIQANPEMVSKITKKARQKVAKVLSWKSYAQRMLDLASEK